METEPTKCPVCGGHLSHIRPTMVVIDDLAIRFRCDDCGTRVIYEAPFATEKAEVSVDTTNCSDQEALARWMLVRGTQGEQE